MATRIEMLEGISKEDVKESLKNWEMLNEIVNSGKMPDVEMDITDDGCYIDRWFHLGKSNFCITNEYGEEPRLAEVVEMENDAYDIDTYNLDDLREYVKM